MFYKLKINYNKSEFSLSCLDKDIIEREMDLYFAFFSNAGEDFISKIKKIEVTHPKVKKIDEMVSSAINNKAEIADEKIKSAIKDDTLGQNLTFSSTEEVKAPKIEDKKDVLKITDAYCSVFDKKNEEKIDGIYSIKQTPHEKPAEKEVIINNAPINEEPNQNTDSVEIIEKYGFNEPEQEISPKYSEIQSMIKLAQSKIEADDLKKQITISNKKPESSNNNTVQVNNDSTAFTSDNEASDRSSDIEKSLLEHFMNDEIENHSQTSEKTSLDILKESCEQEKLSQESPQEETTSQEENNEKLLDNIFSKNIKDDEFSEELKSKIEDMETKRENGLSKTRIEDFKDCPSDLIFSNKKKEPLIPNKETPLFEIQQPTEAELREYAQNLDNKLQQSLKQDNLNKEIECAPETTAFDDISQNAQSSSKAAAFKTDRFNPMEPIDFASFLSIFKPKSINDEFLICAYYIKNIIKEQNFTMKSLNAKLFKAAGDIAGTSVLDDLVEIGLIETHKGEDSTIYSISPAGEEYFEEKFQR